AYAWGNGVGIATNTILTGAVGRGIAAGRELTIPFTNGARVGLGVPGALTKEGDAYWAARLPHYHRSITDEFGNTVPGGSLNNWVLLGFVWVIARHEKGSVTVMPPQQR
ncbi:MAG: hypothetical protein ACRDRT_02830, partial [Pseudonocardiaceae bacterium]